MPEIGDIKRGIEIGRKGNRHYFIFIECPECHKTRWISTQLYKKLQNNGLCHMCEIHNRKITPIMERFMSKVQKTDDCWIWIGSHNNHGYGKMMYPRKGEFIYAHRLSYILHKGEIPDGLLVLHKCDNPLCVNPSHLFLGTQLDNVHDAIHKGRLDPSKCGKLALGIKHLFQRG